jgi:thioredoxin reductase
VQCSWYNWAVSNLRNELDVVIIGGGPAGLAAATVLGRAHRKVAVVDAGQQSNRTSAQTHAVFSRDGMPPEELYAEVLAQLRRYPSVGVISANATSVGLGAEFTVGLDHERTLSTKFLLLAQGMKFSYPPIPGITELWGREVWHCPYCHGFEASGQRLLAVGDEIWVNGMKELLPIWTDKITWAPIEEMQSIRCAGDGEKGIIAVLNSGELAFDQCIVQSTAIARDDLADQLGCERNDKGQLVVNEKCETSVERVYAAGDQTPAGGQVNIAVGSGHEAALAINEALGIPQRPSNGSPVSPT